MNVKVVIGANFGDEAKGKMVDYFSRNNTIVCRYSGGANAGHTVELIDGTRHVFHHFGAGSFKNASTHLSKHFISNPMLYLSEKIILNNLGLKLKVSADPNGLVTVPADMMLNQMVEEARGTARHGSCGVGINETTKRHEAGFKLTVGMLQDKNLNLLLFEINNKWVKVRAEQLGIYVGDVWQSRLNNFEIVERWLDSLSDFDVDIVSDSALEDDDIVFEGSQGLLLDEDHRFFPHVTHAHTGLKNVIEICQLNHIPKLEVIYATRAYSTRHGAGPFPYENNISYKDETNAPNDWQGTLRFGLLDVDLLKESINNDLKSALHSRMTILPSIAISCLDQVGDKIEFVMNSVLHKENHETFRKMLSEHVGIPVKYLSDGPTRNDISVI